LRNSLPLSAVMDWNCLRNARAPQSLSMLLRIRRTDLFVLSGSLRAISFRVLRSTSVNRAAQELVGPVIRVISQCPNCSLVVTAQVGTNAHSDKGTK